MEKYFALISIVQVLQGKDGDGKMEFQESEFGKTVEKGLECK